MMWRNRRNKEYNCFDPIVPQNPRPRHLVYCSCEMKKALLLPLAYNKSLSFASAPDSKSKLFVRCIFKPVQKF